MPPAANAQKCRLSNLCACLKLKPDVLMMQAARNRQRSDSADWLRPSRVRARPHSMRDGCCRRVTSPDFITLLRDCDNICRHGGTDRLGKTKLEKADGTRPAILRTLKIGAKGTGGVSLMIPSIAELRKRLVPLRASDSEANSLKGDPQVSAATSRAPLRHHFASSWCCVRIFQVWFRSRSVCRLCRKQPECSVILRPRHLKSPSERDQQMVARGLAKARFCILRRKLPVRRMRQGQGFI